MLEVKEDTLKRLREIDLVELDEIIESYDYDLDPVLQSDEYLEFETAIWQEILDYGIDTKIKFGRTKMAPHLMKAGREISVLLAELGFSRGAQSNAQRAFQFHDFGKTYEGYEVGIWSQPERPTNEDKIETKKHHAFGPQIWFERLENTSKEIREHPHNTIIIPALMAFHHEKLSGAGVRHRKAETLGVLVRTSCIVDAYCGDIVKRPHQDKVRTPEEAIIRMACANGETAKYEGCFDIEILQAYARIIGKKTGKKIKINTPETDSSCFIKENKSDKRTNASR